MVKKILLIDDDLYIRELYQEILKDAGYEVITAVDGEEGFHKINSEKYHLILLDIMMPRLDGLGLLIKLTQEQKMPKNTPVVILTNLAHESVIKKTLESGAIGFLIKSDLTPDLLVRKINSFIK